METLPHLLAVSVAAGRTGTGHDGGPYRPWPATAGLFQRRPRAPTGAGSGRSAENGAAAGEA